jgi:hypothetical protein
MKRLISIILTFAMVVSIFPLTITTTSSARTYTIDDALAILKHLAGIERFTISQMAGYDFDGDNEITINDALFVLKVLAGIIEKPTPTPVIDPNLYTGTNIKTFTAHTGVPLHSQYRESDPFVSFSYQADMTAFRSYLSYLRGLGFSLTTESGDGRVTSYPSDVAATYRFGDSDQMVLLYYYSDNGRACVWLYRASGFPVNSFPISNQPITQNPTNPTPNPNPNPNNPQPVNCFLCSNTGRRTCTSCNGVRDILGHTVCYTCWGTGQIACRH